MPIIHIRSLPLAQDTDIARVLEGISKEFAEAIAINVDQIYISWEYLAPGCYVHQGKAGGLQEDRSHPLQVALLTPDNFSQTRIELMLGKIAEAISRRIHVPFENILVTHQDIKSGRVFDQGKVVKW